MFTPSPKALALLIVNQRKKLKLSQTDLGNLVGLKQKTISAFENMPEHTQLDTLFRILSAVNLEMKITEKNKIAKVQAQWKEEW